MHSKKMMKVAKHALAIWLKPHDEESLKEQLEMCSRCWNCLPQRILKKWVKTLSKNPELYEFTGMAFKEKRLEDHFSTEEIERNSKYLKRAKDSLDTGEYTSLVSNIVIHRWVNKESPDDAFAKGYKDYYGTGYKEYIPGYNIPMHQM